MCLLGGQKKGLAARGTRAHYFGWFGKADAVRVANKTKGNDE